MRQYVARWCPPYLTAVPACYTPHLSEDKNTGKKSSPSPHKFGQRLTPMVNDCVRICGARGSKCFGVQRYPFPQKILVGYNKRGPPRYVLLRRWRDEDLQHGCPSASGGRLHGVYFRWKQRRLTNLQRNSGRIVRERHFSTDDRQNTEAAIATK